MQFRKQDRQEGEALRSATSPSRGRPNRRPARIGDGLTALALVLGLGTATLGVAAADEPRRAAEREHSVLRDTGDRTRGASPNPSRKPSSVSVVRALYAALSAGDVPGVVARLHPDVVVDEPPQLPWGGVTRGRDAYVAQILGGLSRAANITITNSRVFKGEGGRVVGQLTGTLTARTSGEVYPVTFVELHEVRAGTVRRMDIYVKDPTGLAAFIARSTATP